MKYIGQDPAVLDNFVTAVANGAISSGDPCIIESAGTVTPAAETSQSAGAAVTFLSERAEYRFQAYDSANDKHIIVYQDGANSAYGTAVVATISGTSVSFGTSVVFESAGSFWNECVYDPTSGKILVVYQDNPDSATGKAIVGTVSGTSISFGSPTSMTASTSELSVDYDSSGDKFLIAYRDYSANRGKARIATVSGTTVSVGSETQWASSSVSDVRVCRVDANKFVIVYQRSADIFAIVASTSGSTPTYGSEASVIGTTTSMRSACSAGTNKFIACYRDNSNSSYGTAKVGTVSGTSISFGSAVVYNSANTVQQFAQQVNGSRIGIQFGAYVSASDNDAKISFGDVDGTSVTFGNALTIDSTVSAYDTCFSSDPSSGKLLCSWSDFITSNNDGEAAVVQDISTNVTAENFIGFADKDYADGADAVIQAKGAVNDKQTSLTAGQSYFVQTDGTLGTTASNPSVFAGTAVSATQLIVKG